MTPAATPASTQPELADLGISQVQQQNMSCLHLLPSGALPSLSYTKPKHQKSDYSKPPAWGCSGQLHSVSLRTSITPRAQAPGHMPLPVEACQFNCFTCVKGCKKATQEYARPEFCLALHRVYRRIMTMDLLFPPTDWD